MLEGMKDLLGGAKDRLVSANGRSVDDSVRQADGFSGRAIKKTMLIRPNGKVKAWAS